MAKGEQVFTSCTKGGPVFVYVKDGRIPRIEPLQYSPDDAGRWTIEARGKKFSPPNVALLAPYILSERSRTYCKERHLYPMKRVDYDPKNRNPQNRGKSGYERISWDKALDIICEEIIRIQANYGPGSILATPSSHHNWGNINYRHSSFLRFIGILGCTYI